MKIVCQSSFLEEGLREAGHEVFPVCFDETHDINEQIAAVCRSPDVILMEHWGNSVLPPGLCDCPHRLVAYCVDSSINEYILCDYLHLFDDVFVDQLSSVGRLQTYGVTAQWLPLCVSGSAFREQTAKAHDIAFVGRITDYRTKRQNLLRYIQQHFPVHMVEGVTEPEMQDIFAGSKIVLNENLFSGFTLRVLQGMAAGSLVLTEAGGDGVSDYFTDGTHLVCYSPETVIAQIKYILENYEQHHHITIAGQDACGKYHTSGARAAEMLACLERKKPCREKQPAKRKYYLAQARYSTRIRFGGSYSDSVTVFQQLTGGNDEASALAAFALGNIAVRRGLNEKALQYFMAAVQKGYQPYTFLKLAMFRLKQNDITASLRFALMAASKMPGTAEGIAEDPRRLPATDETRAEVLYTIARLYFLLDRPFQAGYFKNTPDYFPDTAVEIAFIAWRIKPSPQTLDLMFSCYGIYQMEGELLPELTRAVDMGIATQAQIERGKELAVSYYDMALAEKLARLAGYQTDNTRQHG